MHDAVLNIYVGNGKGSNGPLQGITYVMCVALLLFSVLLASEVASAATTTFLTVCSCLFLPVLACSLACSPACLQDSC